MRLYRTALTLLIGILATAQISRGQSPVPPRETPEFETRSELEAQASAAEANGDHAQIRMIRYRLEHGDFQDGDRIVVTVEGAGRFTDTLVVRSGKKLQVPQMSELPLNGVLRSELKPKLANHIGQYLRNPVVKATPLVRVGVLGNVVRPGYYYVSADLPLSDVLMAASGPTSEADVAKVSVRRNGVVVIDEKDTRRGLTQGASIDMLHIQAGDEISIGRQRRANWGVIVPAVSGLLGLLIALTQIR
jgi:protein involved in polysaccharide export with SLBB domain